jgi:hypothetical protein
MDILDRESLGRRDELFIRFHLFSEKRFKVTQRLHISAREKAKLF